ncbi:hypothetical protein [Tessaracoccus defluvii]|uniref:hypothetical protein n=1 Tax=Tessaracoccus defluvii TaxID=1285901 RepID=UPI0031DE2789
MSDSAILIGHGQAGLAVARRAAALAGHSDRVQACEPSDFLATLERRAGQVPGNTAIRTVHVVQTDGEEDMRAALAFLPEVARIDTTIAVHVDQWIIAMVGQRWDDAELDILTGADPGRPPYSLLVVSRSNEARALLPPEAELAMAGDLAHALTSGPLRQALVAGQGRVQVGAGAAAAYYRREPILAGILAFHARRSLLDPILEPWPSEGRYAQQADGWLDAVSGGVEALGAELARGINGPRPRDLVAVDPHTGTATPPELLVDTLQTYIDLTVNDRLARATRSVDEVAARQRARLREQLFTSTMEVLHESQNLGATTEFLEYLSTALGREAGAVWAASSAVGPEFDPPPLLKEIGEAVAGLPHGPSGATRAAGMAGIGLGVGVVLGGFVAPLVALGVGAAAALTGAGGVLLGVWMKRRALDGARRRLLDQLQQHVWFRVEQHITDQLWGLLAYLVRLVGRPDDLESGCLGGVAKMRASSQDYLQHLERVIAERFHEELTPTEFSIFLPRPEDSPTEALAARYGLPPEFDVTRALLAGITDGMDRPGGFVPEEAFARFYTAGGANPPSGLWNNLSELLADSPGALAAVGGLLSQGTAPLAHPQEDVPQDKVSRFAYLSRNLPEDTAASLLAYADATGSSRGDDPDAITWVSVRRIQDVRTTDAGGSRDHD